jgi:hypothetical protein
MRCPCVQICSGCRHAPAADHDGAHHQESGLPDGRAELYENLVHELLWEWEERRAYGRGMATPHHSLKSRAASRPPAGAHCWGSCTRPTRGWANRMWKRRSTTRYEVHGRAGGRGRGDRAAHVGGAFCPPGALRRRRRQGQGARCRAGHQHRQLHRPAQRSADRHSKTVCASASRTTPSRNIWPHAGSHLAAMPNGFRRCASASTTSTGARPSFWRSAAWSPKCANAYDEAILLVEGSAAPCSGERAGSPATALVGRSLCAAVYTGQTAPGGG